MEKEIWVGQIRTNYIEKGEGVPFVILHGWDVSFDKYLEFQDLLASRGFKVFLPALPGLGENNSPKEIWSTEDYTKWLFEFTEKLNIKKFFLFGHSFGSIIAIRFATLYPEKLFGLILSGPQRTKNNWFNPIKLLFMVGRALKVANKAKKILPESAVSWIEKQHGIYKRSNGRMFKTLIAIFSGDMDSYLDKIKTPTLILCGQKDNFIVIGYARKLLKRIPDSSLKIFERTSHNLQLICPKELTDEIIKFIETKSTSPFLIYFIYKFNPR